MQKGGIRVSPLGARVAIWVERTEKKEKKRGF